MTVSYRMSWDGGLDNDTILEVITTEKYRCIGPVNIAQAHNGAMGWHLDPLGKGYDPDSRKPVCWTVEEMVEKGWVERVDE